MLDTSNTPSPLNTTPRPDELTSVRKLPVMFGPCPNISGGINDRRSDSLWPTSGTNAFWSTGKTEASEDLYAIDAGRNFQANVITFDASRSSNIYKTSSTVQPPALQVLPCIRI